ncbi:MAG: PKD domain-containing protein [Bacteroidetes bacterium]|nr:PKD domain-containing protein [Bacteroidota bacterium]
MKKYFSLTFLLCFLLNIYGQNRKVLFIGNSYTYVNNLPQTIADIALSKGDTINYDSSAPGGYTFNLHTTNATTISKINSQEWDFVVLQEQSQLPSFDPVQVAVDVFPFAHMLDSMILNNDSCSETIFYMTWGRQNGDASNCAAYPPVCTFDGMQQRLRESYIQMSVDNHASVSPVGVAWKNVRDNYPSINLYQADESHPSIYGTYLAACVFYSSFFHKSSVGSSFLLPGISISDGLILQTIASSTVLDSISLWQGNSDIPNANFDFLASSNSIQFHNTSDNSTSYIWDFGDGNYSSQINPQNIYAIDGQYVVTLTAASNCLSFIYSDTITVNSLVIPKQVNDLKFDIYPIPLKDELFVDFKGAEFGPIELEIYNSFGQMVVKKEYADVSFIKENMANVSSGLYTVLIFSDGQLVVKRKILKWK